MQQTALMKYAQTYKRAAVHAEFPLLKTARLTAYKSSREDGVLATEEPNVAGKSD